MPAGELGLFTIEVNGPQYRTAFCSDAGILFYFHGFGRFGILFGGLRHANSC